MTTKRTKLLMSTVAVVGLALAGTIPALAQNEQPAEEPAAVCPYHDQANASDEDMSRWMGSAGHDQMHEQMGGEDGMMGAQGAGPGTMMGGMTGADTMMGSGAMMGSENGMMGAQGAGPGSMMGGMTGTDAMMGSGAMMGGAR
jgi:hypothetical protein